MAYTAEARALRRCTHVYGPEHARGGERCRAYALWDDPQGRCAPHAGRTRGVQRMQGPFYECATRPRCHCRAYAFPHRPGGGNCCWPDPPTYIDPAPAGTHSPFRIGRPVGYASVWTGAARRSFDVTPPGVKRRSQGREVYVVSADTARALAEGRPASPWLDTIVAELRMQGVEPPSEDDPEGGSNRGGSESSKT